MKQKLDYFDVNNRIIQIMREKGYNKNSLAKVSEKFTVRTNSAIIENLCLFCSRGRS